MVTSGLLAAALTTAWLLMVRAAVRARRGEAPAATDGETAPMPRPAPQWLAGALADLDVATDPAVVWRAWAAAVVAAPLAAFAFAGPGLAVLTLVVVAAGPPAAWRANRGRRDARLAATLPIALEAVARSLRSGATLARAVGEAGAAVPGRIGSDLLDVARSAEVTGVVEALETWGRRRPLPGIRLAVAALCLGAETGGAQARAVDGVAVTLRQRLGTAAEARALASQARASAAVIAVAPLVFCALASATDPGVGSFLFRSGAGLAVLAVGLTLDAVGALWMARLTRLTP